MNRWRHSGSCRRSGGCLRRGRRSSGCLSASAVRSKRLTDHRHCLFSGNVLRLLRAWLLRQRSWCGGRLAWLLHARGLCRWWLHGRNRHRGASDRHKARCGGNYWSCGSLTATTASASGINAFWRDAARLTNDTAGEVGKNGFKQHLGGLHLSGLGVDAHT